MPRNKDGHYYYGFYPTIWRADTMNLTLAEDGAYRRLVDEYRLTRTPLPADDRSLARIVGVGLDEWLVVRANVIKYFYLEETQDETQSVLPGLKLTPQRSVLRHRFCDKELEAENLRLKNGQNNGEKGGRPSKKSVNKQEHKPNGNQTETQQKPTGNLIKSNQIK